MAGSYKTTLFNCILEGFYRLLNKNKMIISAGFVTVSIVYLVFSKYLLLSHTNYFNLDQKIS